MVSCQGGACTGVWLGCAEILDLMWTGGSLTCPALPPSWQSSGTSRFLAFSSLSTPWVASGCVLMLVSLAQAPQCLRDKCQRLGVCT